MRETLGRIVRLRHSWRKEPSVWKSVCRRSKCSLDPLCLVCVGGVVRVDQRGLEVAVPHHLLQGSHRYALRGELSAERVAEVVKADLAAPHGAQRSLEALEELGAVDRLARVRVRKYEILIGAPTRGAL